MVVLVVVVACVCIWMSYWGGVTGSHRVALLEQERIAPGDVDLFVINAAHGAVLTTAA